MARDVRCKSPLFLRVEDPGEPCSVGVHAFDLLSKKAWQIAIYTKLLQAVKLSFGSPPTQISSWVWKRVLPPYFGASPRDAEDASKAGAIDEVVDFGMCENLIRLLRR
jgi:hypothetical protein